MRYILGGLILAAGLAGCQADTEVADKTAPKVADASTPLDFRRDMVKLCGQTLTGKVVSNDPQDADWRGEVLTVGPITCASKTMTMPLAVGEDTSRVWTVTRNDQKLSLSHAHTLKDGSPDPVTGYGGTSDGTVANGRVDFPVDQYSIDVFRANGLDASVTNTWSLEIKPDEIFAYELNREGRHFRAEFPLK